MSVARPWHASLRRGADRCRRAGRPRDVRRRRHLQGQGRLRERRPARAGQRGARGRPAGRHGRRDRARRLGERGRDDGGRASGRAAARGHDATIRATSLSGIANRYISLKPGPNDAAGSRTAAGSGPTRRPPRSTSTCSSTRSTRTRAQGLRNLIRGYGDWYDGRGAEAGESTKYFAPFLASTTRLARRAGARPGGAGALPLGRRRHRRRDRRAPRRPGRARGQHQRGDGRDR